MLYNKSSGGTPFDKLPTPFDDQWLGSSSGNQVNNSANDIPKELILALSMLNEGNNSEALKVLNSYVLNTKPDTHPSVTKVLYLGYVLQAGDLGIYEIHKPDFEKDAELLESNPNILLLDGYINYPILNPICLMRAVADFTFVAARNGSETISAYSLIAIVILASKLSEGKQISIEIINGFYQLYLTVSAVIVKTLWCEAIEIMQKHSLKNIDNNEYDTKMAALLINYQQNYNGYSSFVEYVYRLEYLYQIKSLTHNSESEFYFSKQIDLFKQMALPGDISFRSGEEARKSRRAARSSKVGDIDDLEELQAKIANRKVTAVITNSKNKTTTIIAEQFKIISSLTDQASEL